MIRFFHGNFFDVEREREREVDELATIVRGAAVVPLFFSFFHDI